MENTDKNKLSRTDLFSMAVGQIIGVGIITIISMIPQIYIGGTANFIGGQYSQIAVLSGKRLAGVYLYIQLFSTLAISMYTISFADYFLSLFPSVNAKLLGVIVLTILFGTHLFGVKQAAILQNILCAVLAVAIASYIVLGLGHIQRCSFRRRCLICGKSPHFMWGMAN